jgi:hypothetical protein
MALHVTPALALKGYDYGPQFSLSVSYKSQNEELLLH